jgi:glycosyltransferase involved in cell wall biosynthesis
VTFALSVVIPVRDGERYLGEAIDSVLGQQPPPHEVIVVDDGSVDRSAELAQSYGGVVCCVRQAAAGIGAARNRGVALAGGTHLAFLDADDRWDGERIAGQLALLSARPELELVGGWVEEFWSPDLPAAERARLRPPARLQAATLPGTILVPLARFRAVGPFAEDWVTGEFIDWMVRAREGGLREAMVERRVLWRRLHASNNGRLRRDGRQDYLRVAREALQRRRGAGGAQ